MPFITGGIIILVPWILLSLRHKILTDLIQLSVTGDPIKAARPCLLRRLFFSFSCLLTLQSGLRNKTGLMTELEVYHDRDTTVNVLFFPLSEPFL